MAEDTRPFALDDDASSAPCCSCNCLSTIKHTRKELQRQEGCGCLGYSPAWLQRFVDIRVFVCVICMYWLLYTTMEYYLVAVITTIEKRFGYSSSHSGLLISIREIAYVLVVTFTSHFARNIHRPRLIATSGILGSIGGLVYAVPHFLYDKSDVIFVNGEAEYRNEDLLCTTHTLHPNVTQCSLAADTALHTGSYAFFVVGSIIMGVALSPMTALSLTYVDDSVGPKRAAFFIGFMNMMRPLGPVLAFVLGGIFTSKYETLHDPGFDQKDPRWVGAWWIGYLLVPCLLLLPVLFLPLFPFRIPRDPVKDADHVPANHVPADQGRAPNWSVNGPTVTQVPRTGDLSLKEFFSSLCALLRNPVYMTLQLGGCLSAFVISGLFPFIPKYMEVMFHLSASFANILAGCVSALMAAAGVLAGGILSGKMRWSPKQLAIFILAMNIVFAVCVLFLIPIRCPDINLVKTSPANSTCLDSCHCLPDQFHAVCGEDGHTYRSPCEAGCHRSHENNTWSECSCVSAGGGSVRSGVCTSGCQRWIPFVIFMSIGAFALMSASVPGTTICLRGVEEKHRAIAFGFSGTLLAFTSFVPGPMIYGALIDSTCLVWRESCGQRGECLLYDDVQFSVRAFTATCGFKVVAGMFYTALVILLKRKEQQQLNSDRNDVRYYGGNAARVESPSFRDNHEVQLRI